MKTPDEIKKALECCFYDSAQCGECPYYPVSCDRELVRDAREYIRQLEAERDALLNFVERYASCCLCKNLIKYGGKCTGGLRCKMFRNTGLKFEWIGIQKED